MSDNEQNVNDEPVVIADDTQPGSPDRLPKVSAMNQEGVYDPVRTPQPFETDVLGTTDGEEPRVIEEDLVTKISRPIEPSALPASSTEAKVEQQTKDDHQHVTETVDQQNPLPGVGVGDAVTAPQPRPNVVEQEVVPHDNRTENTVVQPAGSAEQDQSSR